MKFLKILLSAVAIAGVQNALAKCEGTLYLEMPDDWQSFYILTDSKSGEAPFRYDAATGYLTMDLARAASGENDSTFALANRLYMPMKYIVQAEWNRSVNQDSRYLNGKKDIKCPGAGNSVFVLEDPEHSGKTLVTSEKPTIKYLYVLPPKDREWWRTAPRWSGDGTYASGIPLKPSQLRCGWFYASWVSENLPSNFILFRNGDGTLKDAIGAKGQGAALEPIPLDMLFDAYETDTVFFFAEKNDDVFALSDNGDAGYCRYVLPMTFYDTDAELHGAFTCDAYPLEASNSCYSATAKYNYPGEGEANTVPCIGLTPGIVNAALDPQTKKPTYNAESGCFVSAEAFDVMFKETPGVNVMHEGEDRDVHLYINENGLWEFNSYVYKYSSRAFSPLNDLADSVESGKCSETCATAATLRVEFGGIQYGAGSSDFVSDKAKQALGDVFDWSVKEPKTGLPYIALYPAQAGEFADGDKPNVYNILSWDDRVKSNGNQHFCLETHSKFIYQPGEFLSVLGDDDIWVFIDNKLAIDLGGLHLPAPGYVNLDEFEGGSGKLEAGNVYDFDMFFCDRRTEMSNLHILTNMLIDGADGTDVPPVRKPVANFAGKAPGFTARNISRSTLSIVVPDASAKKYAVMDLQGRIVRQGIIAGAETLVPSLNSGSYIVKVGAETRRVNIR